MEIAYLHLVTNHIPIIGIPVAIVVLLLGIWRKSPEIKAVAFLLFTGIGLLTIMVYFLGQGGEDFIEELPGVSHDTIEEHEEFALPSLIVVLITAAAALFALVRYGGLRTLLRRDGAEPAAFPGWLTIAVLVLALVSAGMVGWTARLGGAIRHPEFHGGVTQAASTSNNEAAEEAEENDGDDESGRGRGRGRSGR